MRDVRVSNERCAFSMQSCGFRSKGWNIIQHQLSLEWIIGLWIHLDICYAYYMTTYIHNLSVWSPPPPHFRSPPPPVTYRLLLPFGALLPLLLVPLLHPPLHIPLPLPPLGLTTTTLRLLWLSSTTITCCWHWSHFYYYYYYYYNEYNY